MCYRNCFQFSVRWGGLVGLLVCLPSFLLAQSDAEWQRAERGIERLAPGAFAEMPAAVRGELERRGCRVPQVGGAFGRHRSNVISGRFARARERDWAVLCSRGDSSRVLLFWGGRADSVEAWEASADAGWLQAMGKAGIQYSRYIAVADSASVDRHARDAGAPLPAAAVTHEGLEAGFAGKASSVFYWTGGQRYELQGGD